MEAFPSLGIAAKVEHMWQYEEFRQTEEDLAQSIARAHSALDQADYILLGAGAGLSTAAGLEYFGDRFNNHFKNFIEYYGMTDMYSAGFYPFPDEESKWAYWAEHIWMNRLSISALPLYEDLYNYLHGRDYFIHTTNVDAQFAKAGFPKNRIFATQGDYAYMQCRSACHETLYPVKEIVDAIRLDTRGGERVRISNSELVPKCPKCSGPMIPWLRVDETFIEDDAWHEAQNNYLSWLNTAVEAKSFVLLELGVGFNTPGIIRFPFERMAQQTGCTLIRMNFDSAGISAAGIANGISIQGNIADMWPRVVEGC